MKRIALLPVAALALVGACADTPTAPTVSPAPLTPSLGTEPPPQITGRTTIDGSGLLSVSTASATTAAASVDCTEPSCIVTGYTLNKTVNTELTQFTPQNNTPLPAYVRQTLKQEGTQCYLLGVLQPCDVTNTSEGAIFRKLASDGSFVFDGKGLAYTVGICTGYFAGQPCYGGTQTATTVLLDQFDGPPPSWECLSSASPEPSTPVPFAVCHSARALKADNWLISPTNQVVRIPTSVQMTFLGGACVTGYLVSNGEGGFYTVFPEECPPPNF